MKERKIDYIILHCSDTPCNKDFDVNDIDRWHKEKGWNGVGYHYVIKLDGTIQEGRPESEIGAHCKGYNENSIGICYIGGRDEEGNYKDTRTTQQKVSMLRLLAYLKSEYPDSLVYGHDDFSEEKEFCPGFKATEYNF